MAETLFTFRFLGLILTGSIVTILSGCSEGTTREVQATVFAVDGPALINNPYGQSLSLASGAHPGKGDILETPGSSRAAIALLPNLLIQLDRDGRLEIMRLAITKNGNETGADMQGRYADLRLRRGRLFVSQVWGEATARFTVTTAQGELVTSSNALFWLESDEQKTRITCVSGSVGFQSQGAEAITGVPPGFIGEWSGASPSLVASETDPRGPEDLREGLEAVERLRAFLSQNHRGPPL